MLADLVVLSTNIFDSPKALATARVVYTIFDGRVVYTTERGTN
jgi:predicted amidohydrolase YtcJ